MQFSCLSYCTHMNLLDCCTPHRIMNHVGSQQIRSRGYADRPTEQIRNTVPSRLRRWLSQSGSTHWNAAAVVLHDDLLSERESYRGSSRYEDVNANENIRNAPIL